MGKYSNRGTDGVRPSTVREHRIRLEASPIFGTRPKPIRDDPRRVDRGADDRGAIR
jgi:hypothetical protein